MSINETKPIHVACPCCDAMLTIDPTLAVVLDHKMPVKPQVVVNMQDAGVALIREPHDTAAREPRENGWRRVVFAGPDGEQIELRG